MPGRISLRRGQFATNIALQSGSIAMLDGDTSMVAGEKLIYTHVRYRMISQHLDANTDLEANWVVAIGYDEQAIPTPLPLPRSIPTGDQWLWWEGIGRTRWGYSANPTTTTAAPSELEGEAESYMVKIAEADPATLFFQWDVSNASTWFVSCAWVQYIAMPEPLP